MHTERLVIKMYETDLINVTEYQTANQKLTIQRNWQQRVHKMKTNETNTTKYVFDTTICMQTQIT